MLTILALLASSPSALADDTLHPQVSASVQGKEKLNTTLELRGSGHILWAPGPEDDTVLFFLYTGPRIHVTPWFSTAPQIGSVVNWAGEGDLLPLASVWNWIDFNHFHGFVEADTYPDFAGGTVTYFGFYSIDYDRLGLIWVGAHAEQVNRNVNAGPHIGAPLGEKVWVQANYHRGLDNGSNALRLNLNVNL